MQGSKEKSERSRTRRLIALLVGAGVLLAMASAAIPFLTRSAFMGAFRMAGSSMSPTLRGSGQQADGSTSEGDMVFAATGVYRAGSPQRGDIVVYLTRNVRYPGVPTDTRFVSRIVGLPGERVSIRPPTLIVNGQPVLSPAVFSNMAARTNGYSGYEFARAVGGTLLDEDSDEIVLGADEYLLLGDNSAHSLDGRYMGPVKRSDIVARISRIYYPFDRAGPVH